MATLPKIKPCPHCGADTDVYKYDNGWRHVECDRCFYLGPGEGSIRAAIKSHNERASCAEPPDPLPQQTRGTR